MGLVGSKTLTALTRPGIGPSLAPYRLKVPSDLHISSSFRSTPYKSHLYLQSIYYPQ